jgi:hypothetical protein
VTLRPSLSPSAAMCSAGAATRIKKARSSSTSSPAHRWRRSMEALHRHSLASVDSCTSTNIKSCCCLKYTHTYIYIYFPKGKRSEDGFQEFEKQSKKIKIDQSFRLLCMQLTINLFFVLCVCDCVRVYVSFTQVEKCKGQQDVPMRLLPGASGQVADVKCGASFNLALLKVPLCCGSR